MNDSSNDDQSTVPKDDISKDGESSQMAKISKLPLPIAIKIAGKNRRKSLGDLTDKDIREKYMNKLKNIDIIYKIDEVPYEHDTPKDKKNITPKIEIINNDIIKRKSINETENNFSLEYYKTPPAKNDKTPPAKNDKTPPIENHTIISIINKDNNENNNDENNNDENNNDENNNDENNNDENNNDENNDNTSIITYRNYFSYSYYLIKRGIIPDIIANNDNSMNLSIINFPIIYYLLFISGCFSLNTISYISLLYPIFISLLLIYAICYQIITANYVIYIYTLRNIIYLIFQIATIWNLRFILMGNVLKYTKNISAYIDSYKIYFINKNEAKKIKLLFHIDLITYLNILSWSILFSLKTYEYLNAFPLNYYKDIIQFVFFRISFLYNDIMICTLVAYSHFIFLIYSLELKGIIYRINKNTTLKYAYKNYIELINHHRIINRRLKKISSQLGPLIFFLIFVLFIEIFSSLYILNKQNDYINIIYIIITLYTLLILFVRIAEINSMNTQINSIIYDIQIFNAIERKEINRYLLANPAEFSICGLIVTYTLLSRISFILLNVLVPILITWVGFTNVSRNNIK